MGKNFSRFLLIVISLLFFSNCSLFDSVSDDSKLQILLPGNSRNVADSVSVYEITVSNSSFKVIKTGEPGELIEISEIPAGSYDIAATGKDASGNIVGKGAATAEISEGDTANVSIIMSVNLLEIAFDYNDGATPATTSLVAYGSLAEIPAETPERTGFSFLGWGLNSESTDLFDFTTPITENLNLYGIWQSTAISTYEAFLEEITASRDSKIVVSANLDMTSTTTSGDIESFFEIPGGFKKEVIGLTGTETLTFSGANDNETAEYGIKISGELSLKNIKITSSTTQFMHGALKILQGGSLTIEGGTEITGLRSSERSYSAPIVLAGTMTMNGGTINSNTGHMEGGAVKIDDTSAVFTMNDGTIDSNSNTSGGSGEDYAGNGGGVSVENGKFIFNGGMISNNTTAGTSTKGGGVYVSSEGSFVNAGGAFSGNVAILGLKYYVKRYGKYGISEESLDTIIYEDLYE